VQLANAIVEYMAIMSEDNVRFATFLVSKAKGRSDIQAANDAKNVSVNFNQKGKIAPVLGSLYAFANAAIQGGLVIGKMAKNNTGNFSKVCHGFCACRNDEAGHAR